MSLSSVFPADNVGATHRPTLVHHIHHHVVYPQQNSLSLMHALLFLNASLLNFLTHSPPQTPSQTVSKGFGAPFSLPPVSSRSYVHVHALPPSLKETKSDSERIVERLPPISVPGLPEPVIDQVKSLVPQEVVAPVQTEVVAPVQTEVVEPVQPEVIEVQPVPEAREVFDVVTPAPSLRLSHRHHAVDESELFNELLQPSESRLSKLLDSIPPPLAQIPTEEAPLDNLLDLPPPLPDISQNLIVFEDDPNVGPITPVEEKVFKKEEMNITLETPHGPIGVQAPHGHEGHPTEVVVAQPELHDDHHHNMTIENLEEINKTTTHYIQWTYIGAYGQIEWGTYYPVCNGQEQSPIDIKSTAAINKVFPPFRFRGYSSLPKVMKLINNGHSVQMEIEMSGPKAPRVSGGGLPGKEFQFHQLHFHWGATDNVGSEHLVNGKSFPMEIHLVHYNTKYSSIMEALEHPDGLAVLGLFYEKSVAMTPAYFTLARLLANVTTEDSHVEIPARQRFPLKALLPIKTWKFYRYHGSLTTPPCNEAVTWTVFSDWIPVTDDLLNALRHIMIDNYRGPQSYGTRTVYVS